MYITTLLGATCWAFGQPLAMCWGLWAQVWLKKIYSTKHLIIAIWNNTILNECRIAQKVHRKYHLNILSFSRGTFTHVTHLDQWRARENLWWIIVISSLVLCPWIMIRYSCCVYSNFVFSINNFHSLRGSCQPRRTFWHNSSTLLIWQASTFSRSDENTHSRPCIHGSSIRQHIGQMWILYFKSSIQDKTPN